MASLMESIGESIRRDGWENVILGLGGTKDPSAYTTFASRSRLSDGLLEAIYVEDHFAARVVEALPKEALRPGWDLQFAADPAVVAKAREAFAGLEDDLGIAIEMAKGAFWGRAFGGAITWIGADDGGAPDMALDETAIEAVRFLHTFDRRDVQVWKYYEDPSHPKFRHPEIYRVQPQLTHGAGNMVTRGQGERASMLAGGTLLHESRCVVWPGQPTTEQRRIELQGWDDSILERCWDALRQIGEDYGAKSLLLGRISQAIFKLKDLYAMIAGKKKEVLLERMGMLDASRSRSRAILLDLEEDFINVTPPVSGIDLLMDKAILRLAAAAPMPVAVLMGQPLSSLEGTNDGDLEVWNQQAEGWRTLELKPRHERITQLILLSKSGPTGGVEPEEWQIVYRPLRVPTQKELAEARKLQAETDAIRVDKGFASPEAIALARFSPSSGNDLVLDEAELRQNLERRKDLAKQPPKDNAELGTVGARSGAAIEIVQKVTLRQIPRESGRAMLTELFRFPDEVAEQILGPADWQPAMVEPGTPGPDGKPGVGEGAGAPQGLPGFNDGGNPRKEPEVPGAR